MRVGIYKHYKGNLYDVLFVAKHSETLEEMVVYRDLDVDNQLWVRPRTMFESKVMHEGELVYRFEFQGDELK